MDEQAKVAAATKPTGYNRCPKCDNQWITTGMELRVEVGKRSYWAYPQRCFACGWMSEESNNAAEGTEERLTDAALAISTDAGGEA